MTNFGKYLEEEVPFIAVKAMYKTFKSGLVIANNLGERKLDLLSVTPFFTIFSASMESNQQGKLRMITNAPTREFNLSEILFVTI